MKKKSKFKNILLIFIFSIVLSLLIECFCYNFNILKLDINSRRQFSILNKISKIEQNVNNKEIYINMKDIYINKLIINYSSIENSDYIIEYSCSDHFNKKSICLIEDGFNEKFDKTISNINENITSIKIIVDDSVEIKDIEINNKFNLNYYRIIFYVVTIFLVMLVIYFYKIDYITKKFEYLFLIISLLLGCLIVIFIPNTTFYSWDDETHYSNSLKLLNDNVYWSENSWQMKTPFPFSPYSINSKEEQNVQNEYLDLSKEIVNIEKHRLLIKYSEISYIAPSIGLKIANFLKLPFSIKFKVGKFMNVLVYSVVMFMAIKLSKIKKRLLFVIGLIPTTIFMSAQYSYDPPITAFLCLGTSVLINEFIEKEKKISIQNVFIFLFSIIYASFTKTIYAPLIFLILLLPKTKFKDNKQCIKFKIGIILIGFLLLSTFILPTLISADATGDLRGGNTSVSGQLSLVFKNPFGYLLILKNNMVDLFFNKLISKETLGNFAYVSQISDNLYYMFLTLLICVGVTDDERKYEIPKYLKIIIPIIIFGIIVLIWTALYLSFTPVGEMVINGVQGRYFIPLLFPLMVSFCSNKIINNISCKKYNLFIIMVCLFILLMAIYQNILSVYCF